VKQGNITHHFDGDFRNGSVIWSSVAGVARLVRAVLWSATADAARPPRVVLSWWRLRGSLREVCIR
jgi:hypothetical protein